MAKIRGIGNRKGLKGQGKNTIPTLSNANRPRVGKSSVSRRGVKRMFARDPSKANSLIGTRADARFDQQNVNTNGAPPNPTIKRAPRTTASVAGQTPKRASARGVKKVVARSNRSLKKR